MRKPTLPVSQLQRLPLRMEVYVDGKRDETSATYYTHSTQAVVVDRVDIREITHEFFPNYTNINTTLRYTRDLVVELQEDRWASLLGSIYGATVPTQFVELELVVDNLTTKWDCENLIAQILRFIEDRHTSIQELEEYLSATV